MQQAVGGQGLAAIEFKRRSVEPRYFPARLFYNQHARCSVPRIQVELPEAVVASRSHVAQIERSRSRPAHAMGVQRDLVVKINIRIFVPLVAGKPGGQQTFFQRSGFRNVD